MRKRYTYIDYNIRARWIYKRKIIIGTIIYESIAHEREADINSTTHSVHTWPLDLLV